MRLFWFGQILKKIKNSKLILKSSVSYSEVHFIDLFEKGRSVKQSYL